jgi:hypothetical protein
MSIIYESEIEAKIAVASKRLGWWVCKFVSPGKRAVPDRLFIKNGRHVFIEIKRPGETPTVQQNKRHKEMREYGAEVYWVDNLESALVILR